MEPALDLTGFGFTPTESLVYEVLVRRGPGTGYGIARSAGLARANAYSALEGLVQKGAARVDEGRPKRYRPEPPPTLIARIVDRQAKDLDTLSAVLDSVSVPPSPTLVELGSPRGVLQLLSHEIARAEGPVRLLVPADAYPVLVPALRKAAASGVRLELFSLAEVELPFATVVVVSAPAAWPGDPILFAVAGRGAVQGGRLGEQVEGHWGTNPVFVAATELLIDYLRATGR